ncbi:MAG: hypothetical protein GY760_02890 [Deltaproteobacteria bacterium]|nr:hypothetical protein [Deltaproteobacteria bacterium]
MKDSKYNDIRSEKRDLASELSCVEFKPHLLQMSYKFKIRDISPSGMCIVVKESSDLLKYINKGDIYNMKYFPENEEPRILKTEIRHISKSQNGKLEGHFLIGLLILSD